MRIFLPCMRGGSRAAARSKMERLVIIINGFQPLTIITKRSILDLAAALDPPLMHECFLNFSHQVSARSESQYLLHNKKIYVYIS